MKVPFSWLLEYCDPGLPAAGVAELLSMKAVEVERVSEFGAPSADGFVVGHVLGVEKHPNADRLCLARIKGWQAVIRKREDGAPEFAPGERVVFSPQGLRSELYLTVAGAGEQFTIQGDVIGRVSFARLHAN